MRTFFQKNHVSLEVMNRVQHYVFREQEKKELQSHRKGLNMIALLPAHLTRELHAEVHVPTLYEHPFMVWLGENSYTAIVNFCNDAVADVTCAKGELQFMKGQRALGMHFVRHGRMEYERMRRKVELSKGHWISEASWWIRDWQHAGGLKAQKMTDILLVATNSFIQFISGSLGSDRLHRVVRQYAAFFVRHSWDHLGSELKCSDIWADVSATKIMIDTADLIK